MKKGVHILLAAVLIVSFLDGCDAKKENKKLLSAKFDIGTVVFQTSQKEIPQGYELTLLSKFTVDPNKIDPDLSNYFQYQLGKKMKLVVGKDTIEPGLFYYVPLISDAEKEIDCKYILDKSDLQKQKEIIIDDSLFSFNKINISFK